MAQSLITTCSPMKTMNTQSRVSIVWNRNRILNRIQRNLRGIRIVNIHIWTIKVHFHDFGSTFFPLTFMLAPISVARTCLSSIRIFLQYIEKLMFGWCFDWKTKIRKWISIPGFWNFYHTRSQWNEFGSLIQQTRTLKPEIMDIFFSNTVNKRELWII